MRAFIVGVDLIDDDVGAGFEAVLEDVFLLCVIVAATASDQQSADRFGGGSGESEGAKRNKSEQARCCHAAFVSDLSGERQWLKALSHATPNVHPR
jgi:hypothetical protein